MDGKYATCVLVQNAIFVSAEDNNNKIVYYLMLEWISYHKWYQLAGLSACMFSPFVHKSISWTDLNIYAFISYIHTWHCFNLLIVSLCVSFCLFLSLSFSFTLALTLSSLSTSAYFLCCLQCIKRKMNYSHARKKSTRTHYAPTKSFKKYDQ